MVIRNNDGEIIGEMNTIFTREGTMIGYKNDPHHRMPGHSKRQRSR